MFFLRFPTCLLLLALLAMPAAGRAADARPVSIQDVCLMLRSGYTGSEVLRETATRPLLESVTPEEERVLRAAGADQRLVDALKASHALSPAEAAAVRQQQAEQNQRATATATQQAAQLRSQQAPPGQGAVPGPGASGAPAPADDAHMVEKMFHGKLVTFRDEAVRPASSDALENKKLIGLYFSAFTSKAGLTFSSDLVRFYHEIAPRHPEFEIVLISGDLSPYAMENMIRRARMPWLALAFDQIAQTPLVSHFQVHTGASRLVVVDNFGRLFADYPVSMESSQVPMILPDLAKIIADPTHVSALAPPGTAKPSTPMRQ